MPDTLAFSALTSNGQVYEIEFPLHPRTHSADDVAAMLNVLLEGINQALVARGDISNGDVLQALVMALAMRSQVASADSGATTKQIIDLYRDAHAAVRNAASYPTGHA